MSYKSELKQLDTYFDYNHNYNFNMLDLNLKLHSMNGYLADIDELLSDAGLVTIEHTDYTNKIDYFSEQLDKLNAYSSNIGTRALELIDKPLKDDLEKNALAILDKINIESYTTANTVGLKTISQTGLQKKVSSLNISSFIGIRGYSGAPKEFTKFTQEYARQYENRKADLKKINGKDMTLEEYRYSLVGRNTPGQEGKELLSAILDITVIKPLHDAYTGKDWVTGRELSGTERGVQGVSAVVSLITLGTSGLFEMGSKDALKHVARTYAVEAASSAATYTTAAICQDMDIPGSLTIMLSLAAGSTTSIYLNGIEYRYVGREMKVPTEPLRPGDDFDFSAHMSKKDAARYSKWWDDVAIGKHNNYSGLDADDLENWAYADAKIKISQNKVARKVKEIAKDFGIKPNEKQLEIVKSIDDPETQLISPKHIKDFTPKGNFGEIVVDVDLEGTGHIQRISIKRVESLDAPMHHGIDGVYENMTPPPKYLVVDSKYLGAEAAKAETYAPRMSKTKTTGRQLSDGWIRNNLRDQFIDADGILSVENEQKLNEILDAIDMEDDSICMRLGAKVDNAGNVTYYKYNSEGKVLKE